uniref:Ral GTPase-activating protein subunit alpha/beta N-terminal domain-containing protein n=1 Tax=Echeneis naucrates TaxID=173247 RepID=A0A665XA69_ECHNA
MDQSLSSGRAHVSVLNCFPPSVGRDIAVAVLKPLGARLGNPNSHSQLHTEGQVKWTMEVLCYGLTLPLDGDTVKRCVDVYTDWLMALVSPKDSIPPPINREPNRYVQKILRHLCSLFLTRSDQVSPVYLSLCQQVLFAVQLLARESTTMSRDTWDSLLHFLLRINHALLAPPTATGGVSDLSMAVLFEVWLLSCSRCFPSHSLWQRCRQMLSCWRHQPAVVDQWNRVVAALTSRLLLLTFGPAFPEFKVPDEDSALIPAHLDDDRVPQTWFRFLHMFNHSVDVGSSQDEVSRGGDHQQPKIFFKAMRGVSTLVDLKYVVRFFLLVFETWTSSSSQVSFSPHHWKSSSPPPPSPPTLCSSPRPSPSPLRCNVDSLLHLFGGWLFDAALINRDPALSGQSCNTAHNRHNTPGRAEACGTLCRIITCKKTAEDILPVYLSRFYMVLLQGLQVGEGASPPVLASILLNSTCLFCCDLRGVTLLFPSFTSALESVLLDRELLKFKNFVSPVDLRRASILILLSLLPLSLQFGSVQSEVLLDRQFCGDDVTAANLLSLKPRLISIMIRALQTESNAANTQLILAAILNLVQDLALLQAAAQTQQVSGLCILCVCIHVWSAAVQSDTAGDVWVKCVHLLTQRLTSQWKNESAVCLSALEVLGGLGKVEVRVEESERRRAVSSVCCYIVFQCSRPPPLHSKDLHSIIVAAFHCLNIWLTQHPAMLDHQECLLEILEIVELGISGSKSRQEQEMRRKEEKELNPASQRVKEAAEATLSCVMQASGRFPVIGGSLNEDALIGSSSLSDSCVKKFRYFVVDSSVILAILEKPPGTEQASSPSLTVLIRGPSGCRSWTLQLHLEPREGGTHETLIPEHRGAAQEDSGIQHGVKHQLFPENTDRFPSVKADQSISALNENTTEEVQQQLERVRAMLKRQRQVEDRLHASGHSVVMATCRPPPPATNFQTARLFLSHLGLLTPETLKDPGTSGVPAQLLSLNSSLPGFVEDLRRLDRMPSRNCDIAFIFCMRAGQRTDTEVKHTCPLTLSPGAASRPTSWTSSLLLGEFPAVLGDSGGGVFNGQRFVLMFSDTLTELTFIVPSSSHSQCLLRRCEQTVSLVTSVVTSVVEHIKCFPFFVEHSCPDVQLVFIHPLNTGLYRIRFLENTTSKFSSVFPLVDGSLASKRSLGFLVREMVINCCQRKRLESDSAPPPHISRKHAINDIILRYRNHCSEPAFYSALFRDL